MILGGGPDHTEVHLGVNINPLYHKPPDTAAPSLIQAFHPFQWNY